MTMHLLPPMYSTTGKKKGKAKFRNAESANKARRNAESWQQLLEKYDVKMVVEQPKRSGKDSSKNMASPRYDWRSRVDPSRLTDHIPSVDTGASVAPKRENTQYTGDAMIGLGTLHKSNTVPIFKAEDAIDISKMRRG